MSETTVKKLTGDDVLAMPEEATTGMELIDGELVSIEGKMSPTSWQHGKAEFRLATLLGNYADEHGVGEFVTGEVGFYTRGDQYSIRAADIAYIRRDRLPDNLDGFLHTPPDMVVEIISPGNSASEMDAKILEWFDFGVTLVWLVYPRTQRLHVYTSPKQMHILSAEDMLEGGEVLPKFKIQVAEIFK